MTWHCIQVLPYVLNEQGRSTSTHTKPVSLVAALNSRFYFHAEVFTQFASDGPNAR
jgi:hypothetical protein